MVQLIPIIILIPLVSFWFWMFQDMANNENITDDPQAPLTWPPSSRRAWVLAFIFLSIFAAGLYFLTEYRNKV